MPVILTLCDRSADMVKAWRSNFPPESGVTIISQNILTVKADAIAIPANAFGFTDGGIDMAISREIFDWKLQDRLRALIDRDYFGELLVGQALVMPTDSPGYKYAIVAPTMRLPSDVAATVNAYLAMRAILVAAETHNKLVRAPQTPIRSVVIPGLCTGTGKMPHDRSAYQMWAAYRKIVLRETEWTRTLEKQVDHDKKMRVR